MKMFALTCSQCHAPLDFPAESKNIKCEYCGTAIHISTPSENLKSENKPVGESEEIKSVRREIDKLDREWEQFRSQFLTKGENGEYEVPDQKDISHTMVGMKYIGIVIVGFFMIGMFSTFRGIFFSHRPSFSHPPALFFLSPIIIFIVVAAMMFGYWNFSRKKIFASVYEVSLANYKRLRKQLVNKLNRLKAGD
jgi:LSD1 subclass zinc finger protein